MKKTAWLLLSTLLLLPVVAAAAAKKETSVPRLSISTQLDKTAIWVGDLFQYTILVVHDRELEFILDNLKRESLPLTPFVVRSISVHNGEWGQDKGLLEIRLLLTSYEIGKSELTIPAFNLYYLRRLPGFEKRESAAEALRIPAHRVGLRSTLTGGQNSLRDFKPAPPVDIRRLLGALLLGSAGLLLVGLQGARWAWRFLRSDRPRKSRVSPKQRDRFAHEHLARIRAIPEEGEKDATQFCAEVSQFLRQYLNQWLEIQAQGLTPEEIEVALGQANVNGALARQIKSVLEQCETVCYGREARGWGEGLRDEVLQAVERIVQGGH